MWNNVRKLNDDVIFRVADEGELEALIELWMASHRPARSAFTCEYSSFPPERRTTFVAEQGGAIVSSVQLFGIPVRDEGNDPIMVGGIANVTTAPEYRGRGLASHLLKAAIAEMETQGYAWSFLYTGRNSFYEQLGWRTVHRSFLRIELESSAAETNASDAQLQQTPDLQHLRRLCEASPQTPLSRIRSDLDWSTRIPVRLLDRLVFMSRSAYAIVRRDTPDPVLEEWGMTKPSLAAFKDLLTAVVVWAATEQAEGLVISAPILPEARQAIETTFTGVSSFENSHAMVRALNDQWTIGRLISLFNVPHARFLAMDAF